MKAYLDNNVVSSIARSDVEASAISQLLIIAKRGPDMLKLFTSALSLREIEKFNGPSREDLKNVYHLLPDVPFHDDHELLGFNNDWGRFGGASCPRAEDDPVASQLRNIGLERTDAHHVMLAIQFECEVFVTCDRKTILNRREAVEARFSIRLLKPSELVAELSGDA